MVRLSKSEEVPPLNYIYPLTNDDDGLMEFSSWNTSPFLSLETSYEHIWSVKSKDTV